MSSAGVAARAEVFGPEFASLLAAAQTGAAWALRRLYDGLGPAVYGYARTQGSADPEGLVNDTFTRAFRRLPTYTGDEGQLRSWVFTIAHNLLIDERRRASRRPIESGPLPEGHRGETTASAEDAVIAALQEQRVQALLAQLPDDQREVLTLRLLGDLTIPQIAQLQSRSVGATKALQRRGLQRLRKLLGEGVPL